MAERKSNSKTRQFPIGSQSSNAYIKNEIRTSKYTKLNFLPKAIIIQFKRLANVYFLLTAILQSIDIISSLTPFSAIAPFVLVIALSVIREAIEDIPRQKSDKKVNASTVKTLNRENKLITKQWSKVQVGEVVFIKEQEEFPADIILLKSFHENGLAFIETANLDGEKNLKPKYALSETSQYFKDQSIKKLELYNCKIYAQAPDPFIYKFEGAFISEGGTKTALSNKQLLLRGSKLKNVPWVIGVVVYTGKDTKLMKNAEKSKTKQSRIENTMNRLIIIILLFQAIFCITAAVGNRIWNGLNLEKHWYLPKKVSNDLEGFYTYLSYFLLTNTMIPISLIVTIEIVKFIQALFIQQDEDMYNQGKEKGPQVFCSSINEELGLVDYIFSDKTGTLTTNEMIFKNFVIGKQVYGEERPQNFTIKNFGDADQSVKQNFRDDSLHQKEKVVDYKLHRLLELDTSEKIDFSMLDCNGKEAINLKNHKELAMEFLQAISTCHECLAEKDKSGKIIYQGQSQDEVRLVETARDVGFKFLGGNLEKVQIKALNKTKEFEILQIFEFNSERKRMSILLRDGSLIKLYVKGADNVIFERLRKNANQPYQEFINSKLGEFSRKGYRTLVYAMKILNESEYKNLKENIDKITVAEDREEKIAMIANDFEKDLYLIGCTAVEDKLQENVPKVIQDLLAADIKIWMLTGDKLETAENIAYSCRLLKGDMSIMRCSGKTPQEVKKKLFENNEIHELCEKEERKRALLIEGDALTHILEDSELKDILINIVLSSNAVICCRVTPKQKAEMVRIVKNRTNKITLAIGDGANDVNMIQAANIGIGIYGHEGVQAVQASDYAIPEFQGLWRLLLIHGRWSYLRIAEMILYFFYKNMLFTLPQFYFAFINGFSALTIYDDLYVTTYNLIFTALPLAAKAVLEKDVDYKIRNYKKENNNQKPFKEFGRIKILMPTLYAETKTNLIFTYSSFFFWVVKGVLLAILLFTFATYGVANQIINNNGMTISMWSMSMTLYTGVFLIVSIKLATQTRYWNIIFTGCLVLLSLALYFAFTLVYDSFNSSRASYSARINYSSIMFYAFIIFFAGFELLFDLTINLLKKQYKPLYSDIIRNQIKKGKYDVYKHQDAESTTEATKNSQGLQMIHSFKEKYQLAKETKESPTINNPNSPVDALMKTEF